MVADMVTGHVAMWAVRQSPYMVPDALDDALVQFQQRFFVAVQPDQQGMVKLSERALFAAIDQAVKGVPWMWAWNEPKSKHGSPFVFTSRYDKPDPDDDIIDLDAMIRNASNSVWRELEADWQWDAERTRTANLPWNRLKYWWRDLTRRWSPPHEAEAPG